MDNATFDLPAAIHEAFAEFRTDTSLLALPLALHNGLLEPLLPMHSGDSSNSFQTALNELNTVLNPRTPLYILLRRKDTLSAITFVPYLAKESQRAFFLDHRNELVRKLGNEHFSLSLICKEMGEIADARSWTERDENSSPQEFAYGHSNIEDCEDRGCEDCAVKDIGYKRNKCRLCDRRMKNYIAPEALEALKTLTKPGTVVQISVNTTTETLDLLLLSSHATSPNDIASLLPTAFPTFTFYHHPATSLVYLIFHSPDSATVQQRMKHTMAIPGLLVHAEDVGMHVDLKIEIHEPDDLVFGEKKDERVGRFRSVYNREGFKGTELMYKKMEGDSEFLEKLG